VSQPRQASSQLGSHRRPLASESRTQTLLALGARRVKARGFSVKYLKQKGLTELEAHQVINRDAGEEK